MQLVQEDNGKNGSFSLVEGEVVAGSVHYVWTGPEKLIISHTEVSSEYSGQGVGKRLVMAVVDIAREQKLKIIPLCPYANSLFKKMAELKDVLHV